MPLVDGHTHLFPPAQRDRRGALAAADATFAELYTDPKAKLATREELLARLDDAGIEKAVAVGFAFAEPRDILEQNRYLVAAQATSAGRIAAVATANPAANGWRAAAETAIAEGVRGFGELRPHNQGWNPV